MIDVEAIRKEAEEVADVMNLVGDERQQLMDGFLANAIKRAERKERMNLLSSREEIYTEAEAREIGEYMHELPKEELLPFWAEIQKNPRNLWMIHPWVVVLMIRTALDQQTPLWIESKTYAREILLDADGDRERTRRCIFGE